MPADVGFFGGTSLYWRGARSLRNCEPPFVWTRLKTTWRRLLRMPPGLAAAAKTPAPALPTGMRFRACSAVAAEALGQELVLVHLGRGSTFRLNRTGSQVWALACAGRTIGEIVTQLQARWPGAGGRLGADVSQVLAELVREELLQPIAEEAA